ncbi:MAG TPA: hypothetical protein VFG77_00550 [Nitrososphaeraceae archaeon]|nr:hypothetical protein [Nitrososphaeraceae archaeon]
MHSCEPLDNPLRNPLDAVYDLDFGNARPRKEIEEHNILKTIDTLKAFLLRNARTSRMAQNYRNNTFTYTIDDKSDKSSIFD